MESFEQDTSNLQEALIQINHFTFFSDETKSEVDSPGAHGTDSKEYSPWCIGSNIRS